MGVQTTYKCDNNGCGKSSDDLAGWIALGLEDDYLTVVFESIRPDVCGPHGREPDLACSESCALSMIQRHMASHRPVKGGPNGTSVS